MHTIRFCKDELIQGIKVSIFLRDFIIALIIIPSTRFQIQDIKALIIIIRRLPHNQEAKLIIYYVE